jgi:hypothetical protein
MRRISTVLVTAVVGAALLVACGDERPDPGAPPTGATSPVPSGPTGATATTGPSRASGPTAETAPGTDLEDGRHFGYVADVDPSGIVSFDLAYFYTGDEATELAEARGDAAPPPNDYYIVNDNPRLRSLSTSPEITISVFDWNRCCDEQVSIDTETYGEIVEDPDGFVEQDGVLYYGVISPYWVTVQDGVVTAIEEQYLP